MYFPGGVVHRHRRRANSNAPSEGNESNRTFQSAADSYDFEKDYLEDYDYDGE